jgi:lysophospholipase L1-like esterase
MKTIRCMIGVVALLTCLVCAAAVHGDDAAKAPSRGDVTAVNVAQGPAVDGTMKDPVWAECPPWPMGACTSTDPLRYKTWAKVLFDGTHIYVGVRCEEPDTDGMAMGAAKLDDPVWSDDSIEIFLRPDSQQPYCQLVVNPRGVLYDARDKNPAWNSSAEVRASIARGKSWTVTLKIPMKQLGAYVGDGQIWTMNIYRTRPARGGAPTLMYSWALMTEADYHASQEFGVVSGINVPRRADGVTRVRSGPAPRPAVLNRGKQVGGVTIYHKITFDDGLPGWEPGNDGRVQLTRDAVSGKALQVSCPQRWAGARLPISIRGSRGLKMALSMKGRNLPSVGVNIYDTIAGDNTTPYGYRYLKPGDWTPILYFLDHCRYNSRTTGFVGPGTLYSHVQLHGPQDVQPGTTFTIDNFVIYRGVDRQPPNKVTGLAAQPTRSGVRLAWDPADDNVATQLYVVSRADGGGVFQKIAESHTPGYDDPTVEKGQYRYRVCAVDFEENIGGWSDVATVDAVSGGPPRAASREQQDRVGYADRVRRIHARGVGKVRKGHATLFGDSLTGATSYPHCARAAFGNLTVNAFGYPSMRTSFGRNKVAEILNQDNPEFMFILYGTNNNKREDQLPAAMDDLAAIAQACEQHGTVPVLGTIPPRGWTPESAPEANFNKHVVELCRTLKIPTGYIFEDFQAAGDRRTYMGSDGVHWRGAGMEIGARAWAKTLDQIRFVLRDQK